MHYFLLAIVANLRHRIGRAFDSLKGIEVQALFGWQVSPSVGNLRTHNQRKTKQGIDDELSDLCRFRHVWNESILL